MKEGWEVKKLGEVCELINGRAYKRAELLEQGKYPVLRVGNFFTNNHWYYSDLELDKNKYCDNGDLLYAWSASFGPRIWDGNKVIYHYHIWKLLPNESKILKAFLYKFLLYDTEKIKTEKGVGTTMVHVTKGAMEKRELYLPLIEEQKQIVSILDKTFAAIEQARANVQQNLENARELFQSELNAIFSQKGEGWEEKRLGDLSFMKSGGTPLKSKKEYWNNGNIPWYSSGELNHTYTQASKGFITLEGLNNSNAKLFPKGSLLIGMYDTAALKMSILDREATFNQAIAGFPPTGDIDNLFILHYINSKKEDLLNLRRGVRQKNLSLKKLKDIIIELPSLETQKEVINKLDSLNNKINSLQSHYQQKLDELDELKQSLLQQAFSGHLT
ncbi:restriction endonuclease subunit S [Roseivirga sp. BDSF3-8]|uniref:restriction endonuclease subunit S n=1 Tax=Roseivirga sp. BDSF3-8 TaxID=3241598 RepID=UPI0035326A6E